MVSVDLTVKSQTRLELQKLITSLENPNSQFPLKPQNKLMRAICK